MQMKNISLSELEQLIKKNISEKGLSQYVSEETIANIKNSLSNKLKSNIPNGTSKEVIMQEQDVDEEMNPGEEIEMPVQTSQTPAVTQAPPITDEKSMEVAKKEGEVETREQMLSRKEEELNQKEMMLKQKEEEMAYKPQMPEFIEKAEPEKLFIFNMNELNMGAETLLRMPYRLVDNPEEKKSMHELWLEKGKVRAEIFQVDFKKVGEMVFQPMDGICKFEHITSAVPEDITPEQTDSVQAAFDSQKPTEPMLDAVEPVMNVTQPLGDDMGLKTVDVQNAFQEVIEKALKSYLTNKGI